MVDSPNLIVFHNINNRKAIKCNGVVMTITNKDSIDSFFTKLNMSGSSVPEEKRIWGLQNNEMHCECVKCTSSDCTRCDCCVRCDCCFLPASRKYDN